MALYNDETGNYVRDTQVPFRGGLLPVKLERLYMSQVRFFMNYRVVPGFAVFCGMLLTAIVILMSIDEEKYTPAAIVLFCVIGAACIALMIIAPKIGRWELAEELKRYDFTPSPALPDDGWCLEDEGLKLKLTKDGITVGDKFYWYNHVCPRLATSNRFNRIWVALQFGGDAIHSVFIPISPEAVTAVAQFSIPLQNKAEYTYLLSNKEKVFQQIYNTGSFCAEKEE